jgi:hypothetical protein
MQAGRKPTKLNLGTNLAMLDKTTLQLNDNADKEKTTRITPRINTQKSSKAC